MGMGGIVLLTIPHKTFTLVAKLDNKKTNKCEISNGK